MSLYRMFSIFLNAPQPPHQISHSLLFPNPPPNPIQIIQFRPHLGTNCFKFPKPMRKLTAIFRSTKSPVKRRCKETGYSPAASASSSSSAPPPYSARRKGRNGGSGTKRRRKMMRVSEWSVYLIVSLRLARTYVGVTTNFARRLKQHNGELKGGAKASSAGRPWSLACIIRGFENRSEACEFESKWKNISKKMTRKKKEESAVSSVLRHREEALSRVETLFDSTRLKVEWKSTQS